VVSVAVVAAAEELEVGEVGWSAVGPVLDVVGVAPVRGDGASGLGATAVAEVECPA